MLFTHAAIGNAQWGVQPIHLLLLLAIVVVLIRIIQGRKVVL